MYAIRSYYAGQVDQDGVAARDGVEKLGHPVVRLDLDRVGVELQAEGLDEAFGEALPVEVRIRRDMGVVVRNNFV